MLRFLLPTKPLDLQCSKHRIARQDSDQGKVVSQITAVGPNQLRDWTDELWRFLSVSISTIMTPRLDET